MNNKTYFWNEGTKEYFRSIKSKVSSENLYEEIQEFVEANCHLEDDETDEDLVNDLYKQITSTQG